MAGLSCARELRNDFEVTVLEADSRAGGRVFSGSVPPNLISDDDPRKAQHAEEDISVDFGANWFVEDKLS